jgi:hypothetical protein
MNRYLLIGGVSLVVGAGIAGATYLITKRVLEEKYTQRLEEELGATKQFYNRLRKQGEYSSPTSVLRTFQGDEVFDEEQDEPEDNLNWDEEAELLIRDTDKPYIISFNEYKNTRLDYVKTDLTYYENDDIIIDGGTVPYPDVDNLLGEANLQRFGVGSTSKDIVYIRNEELETDFEIGRTDGDFSEEVLGYIEHSHHRGRGKVLRMLREEE